MKIQKIDIMDNTKEKLRLQTIDELTDFLDIWHETKPKHRAVTMILAEREDEKPENISLTALVFGKKDLVLSSLNDYFFKEEDGKDVFRDLIKYHFSE